MDPHVRKEIEDLQHRVSSLERELQTIVHRIQSETDHKIQGMLKGIEAHVTTVIANELKETRTQLSKLDQILKFQEEAATWRSTIQRVEINEKADEKAKLLREEERKHEDELLARKLELAKQAVEIQSQQAEVKIHQEEALDKRIDGRHKRKMAVIGVGITLLSLLFGGGAWTACSHLAPHPTLFHDSNHETSK